jgi:hypothetical protein
MIVLFMRIQGHGIDPSRDLHKRRHISLLEVEFDSSTQIFECTSTMSTDRDRQNKTNRTNYVTALLLQTLKVAQLVYNSPPFMEPSPPPQLDRVLYQINTAENFKT